MPPAVICRGSASPRRVLDEPPITGDIYCHVSPDVARQAMDTLGDAFDR